MFTRAGIGDDEGHRWYADPRQPNIAHSSRSLRGSNNINRNNAYNPINPRGGQGGSGHQNGRNRPGYSNPRNPNLPSAYEPARHPAGQGRQDGSRGRNQQQEEGGEPERKKKFDGPVFGYKRLFKFLSDQPDDVITMICRNVQDWEKLLDQDSISCMKQLKSGRTEKSDDLLYIIVELLGEKVCTSTTVLGTFQNTIISATVGSQNFLRKVEEKVKSYMMDGFAVNDNRYGRPTTEFDIVQNPVSLFQNLIKFIRFTAGKMQSAALDYLQTISVSILSALIYINTSTPSKEVDGLLKQAQELMETMKAIKKEKERKIMTEEVKSRRRGFMTAEEEAMLDALAPPDDYTEIPIVPSVEEIRTNEEPFLRRNKTSGAYDDAHHYLDVQFRLLREDFVRPLKMGVCDYLINKADYLSKKKRPPIGNVRLYSKVTYVDIQFERGTVVHYMQLHPDSYKKVKWDKCKRLLTGTLVVFTADDFETAYFGVVYQRNDIELKKGKLAITWEGDSPEFDKQDEFLMVECEVYFEAYRHTLQVLKEIELQDFPMAKFIVEASSDVRPPAYLRENPHLLQVGNYSCSPLMDRTWPDAEKLGLDQKQFEAFKACLTKEFAIVQGPPGTGKTFLALQVVEVFLRNLQIWNSEGAGGPILVVCYTNHALDQFLQGCLRVFEKLNTSPKIVRVGGRSKTTELEEFSLNRLRSVHHKLHQDPNYGRMKGEAHRALRAAETVRQGALAEFSALSNSDGIILFEKLRIYHDLVKDIPEWILQHVNNPEWFSLDDMTVKRFSVEELLRRWFQINSQVNEPQANGRATAKSKNQKEQESSDSEGEDYDVQELEQNRVVDEGYADIEAVAPKASTEPLSLLFDARKRSLQEQLGELESRRQKMKAEEMAPIYSEMRSLESQCELLEKKEAICKAVITAYRQKTLDVEDVRRYFRDDGLQLKNPPWQTATKWFIYFYILERAKVLAAARVRKSSEDMSVAQKGWQEVLRMGDGRIISKSLIVGMTTTGAAKYNDLLRMTRSRIVLVEEAAEVLESHIVTCITPACQHLILIGDHQQLRPSTTVYELARNYKLDISLFERMVNNKLNCYKINVQHRMRPEIADLVVGTIYPELYNAPRVSHYPRVLGVTSNLFFIDHKFKESDEGDSKSKSNDHEAKFMAALCRYLIQNGYEPQQITILTTYIGQMFLIKHYMRNLETCKDVRVTCVDNFQGEENDIILLSLVRSNDKGNIGFLKTDNRICVAVSRAKHGLFIIGNMSQLEKTDTWKKIKAKLENGRRMGTSITIQCEVHDTQQHVSDDKEFSRLAPEGGCNQECTTALDCGHACKSVCHIQDRDHVIYKCKERCSKFCRRNHQCAADCFRDCPPCRVQVTKLLECGHSTRVNCHEYENDVTCYVVVDKMLPCGHQEKLACYVDPNDYTCKRKVLKDLPCGHKKEADCHVDANKITCGEMVDKFLPCAHTQKDKCWRQEDTIRCDTIVDRGFDLCDHKATMKCALSKDPNVKCKSPCSSRLDCGHACTLICHKHDDPHHTQYTCKKDCGRVCENGHRCKSKHQCFKTCPPCREFVDRRLLCGHTMKMLCFEDATKEKCHAPCGSKLNCGHKCQKECFEACGPCEEVVMKVSPVCGHRQEMRCSEKYTMDKCNVYRVPNSRSSCGHDVRVPCRLANDDPQQLSEFCREPCGYQFNAEESGCDHKCQGTCGECQEGRLHAKCQQKCGKQLVCGHTCNFPCSESCPPCQQPCLMQCEHSKCEAKCGEPCSGCKERCGWNCRHKRCTKLCSEPCDRDPCNEPCPKKLDCGHDCIGFCGEPCPPQCKICNREELTEFVLYGFEEDEDASFVLLEDCGHAIEINGLDHFMGLELNDGEITPRSCPRCKTLITKSRRYGNILRTRLEDIMKVKNHKFGSLKEIQQQVVTLANAVDSTNMHPLMEVYLKDQLIIGKNKKQQLVCKKIDKATLVSLEIIFKLVKEAAANLDDESGLYEDPAKRRMCKADLADRYNKLFESLRSRQLPLSKQELEDFEWEFARMFDLNQMYHIKASSRFTPGHAKALPIWIDLNRKINSRGRYNERLQDDVKASLKELDKVLATGLGITDRERQDILKAFNLREGRWFKCPNGHVYVITECGGAMEEGTCNECGERIGGGSHRLRADNALASEMDGATAPLWPQ